MKNKLPITPPAKYWRAGNFQFPIRKSGFTLIELMAVVAIIMILAAIMLPNIAKHVERGRTAKATADIDVLIKAVNLFQVDNGELPKDLSNLWDTSGEGPYISSDKGILTDNPWHGIYTLDPVGTGSYKIIAADAKGNPKVSKTITFGN